LIRYAILGPLSVVGDAITAGRDRVVLAMLLLHPDRVLGAAELIEAVWGAQPPPTVRAQLQTCVSRLRRALPPEAIMTDPAGYRLRCPPEELDASVFARLVARAREDRDNELFRQALDLWRGPALAEIDSLAVRRSAAVWDERRAVATEEWVELELAAGRARELLGELAGLVEQFPLRERLRGQLMTALWRSGRQADALAEYRRVRQVLSDELGLDPGPELQQLHQQILAGGTPAAAEPAGVRVRCLPRTVGDFTGREELVERLLSVIEKADRKAPVVAVVDGMAGSGKSTLALHVASLVGDGYPDAHLFVDLHGHSTEQPLEPAAALLVLLRQLGVRAERIPASPVERVGLWRTELAGRRALVLLDNAASSAQVADLLPTSPGSLALVTGRRRLIGLDGVHPESLGVLSEAEAVTLLARIAGGRVLAEPLAAAEVVRHCGGLPLALRLAGARLAHRPRWRVADLVDRLGAAPLPELAAENRSVADAFALSYAPLAGPARQMFRLLGLCPGPSFDVLAAAALAGVSRRDAQDALDDLVDVHLVEEPERDVYRLHDLLREYAAALAAELPEAEQRAALIQALDLQVHATAATMPVYFRQNSDRDLGAPAPLRPDLIDAVRDPAARFERERPHLAAFVEAAAGCGRPEYVWWIPRVAWWYMYSHGFSREMMDLLHQAIAIVENGRDPTGHATLANYLASGYMRAADYARGLELLRLSIRLRDQVGRHDAKVSPLANVAAIQHQLCHFAEAVEAAREARRLSALTGETIRGRSLVFNLGQSSFRLGRYAEALYYHRLHLLTGMEHRDETVVLTALAYLQRIRRREGSMTIAVAHRHLDFLLRRVTHHGLLPMEAHLRNDLGVLLRAESRLVEAVAEHQEAVRIARRVGDPQYEAEFLNEFGHTCRAAGDLAQARELYEQVLTVAMTVPQGFEEARAAAGIAECLVGTDPEQARRSWTTALAAFRRMGVPERFEVEKRLGELDQLRLGAGGETMVR
jgi:DNA-binding SARP family transcriptional activator/tetratricopeptide (TPR) repeat protein